MEPVIGEIIVNDGKVFSYLDGTRGLDWYKIGTIESDVINVHGYVQGKVKDFAADQLC